MITHWLVVSYTTFSPLPAPSGVQAVIFFCPHLLSPIASIFRSGAPCAARTFLSCQRHQRQTVAVLSAAKLRKVERKTKKLVSFFAETEYFRDPTHKLPHRFVRFKQIAYICPRYKAFYLHKILHETVTYSIGVLYISELWHIYVM